MKIGIVLFPTYGGSGVVATELGMELARKGHEIHFISYSLPFRLDEFADNVFYHEVRVSDYPLFHYQPYELSLTSKLVDVVKYENLDILHVHYAIPHASAAFMAQQILRSENISIPFITTLHGTDITLVGKDSSYEPVITFAINNSNAVTSVSEDLKNETLTHFHVNRHIDVIPNFICHKLYSKASNLSLKKKYSPNDEPVILHISNFRPVKRVQDAMHFFANLRKIRPVKMLMVGDGPERHKMEDLSRELKVCDDVSFLGKLKSVVQISASADVFILPSETESFGLAALEAMASGVPIIATNAGGLPEVIEHGVSGFLSNVGDTDDMVTNVLKIIDSKESIAKFKANAKNQALKFDIQNVLPMYEELYKKVVKENI